MADPPMTNVLAMREVHPPRQAQGNVFLQELQVRNGVAGLLLSNKGIKIMVIQRKSGARLQILRADKADATWRTLFVQGSVKSIEMARDELVKMGVTLLKPLYPQQAAGAIANSTTTSTTVNTAPTLPPMGNYFGSSPLSMSSPIAAIPRHLNPSSFSSSGIDGASSTTADVHIGGNFYSPSVSPSLTSLGAGGGITSPTSSSEGPPTSPLSTHDSNIVTTTTSATTTSAATATMRPYGAPRYGNTTSSSHDSPTHGSSNHHNNIFSSSSSPNTSTGSLLFGNLTATTAPSQQPMTQHHQRHDDSPSSSSFSSMFTPPVTTTSLFGTLPPTLQSPLVTTATFSSLHFPTSPRTTATNSAAPTTTTNAPIPSGTGFTDVFHSSFPPPNSGPGTSTSSGSVGALSPHTTEFRTMLSMPFPPSNGASVLFPPPLGGQSTARFGGGGGEGSPRPNVPGSSTSGGSVDPLTAAFATLAFRTSEAQTPHSPPGITTAQLPRHSNSLPDISAAPESNLSEFQRAQLEYFRNRLSTQTRNNNQQGENAWGGGGGR